MLITMTNAKNNEVIVRNSELIAAMDATSPTDRHPNTNTLVTLKGGKMFGIKETLPEILTIINREMNI